MKKLLGLGLLVSTGLTMTACKKEEAVKPVELEASTTATAFGFAPHGGEYIGFAKVTTNADGGFDSYKSILVDEIVNYKYLNEKTLGTFAGTEVDKVAGTFCYFTGSGVFKPEASYTYDSNYSKYLKIGSKFYVAEVTAGQKCADTDTESTRNIIKYYEANTDGSKKGTTAFAFTAENAAELGADILANGIKAATLDGTLRVAKNGTADVALNHTKQSTGYGVSTSNTGYNYTAHVRSLSTFAITHVDYILGLDLEFGSKAGNKITDHEELKALTGATGADTPSYIYLIQQALKDLVA